MRSPTGRLMRVAVTGAAGRLGRRARRGPGGRAVHRPGRADRLGPRRVRPRRARRHRGAPRPRPAGGRGPCRRLDRRRRLRARPGACAARATGPPRACSPTACAERGIDLLAISTNEVFDGDTARRLRLPAETTRSSPGNPYGASKAEGERLARGRLRRPTRRRARDRPDGLAVRGARPGLPEPDPRCRRACQGGRRAAAGRRRRVGDADVHGRCGRGDRRAARRGR